MMVGIRRRNFLSKSATAAALGAVVGPEVAVGGSSAPNRLGVGPNRDQFLLGLNTSTIRGQKLSIVDEVGLAAKAGYQAMEPWVDELKHYAEAGGSLEDLRKRFVDAGIQVESAIGFFDWIVDDPERRKKGLEEARRSLEIVQKIGGKRLAAPPVGATDKPIADPRAGADRYRDLLEIGSKIGVVPQAEVWGFSKTLGTLGEAAMIAMESGRDDACILPDVYHLYRGGSALSGIHLLGPRAIHVFHFNDYPAAPDREKLTDADRVFPGDGVAPLKALLTDLSTAGFRVMLSLELFNRKYWSEDPFTVIRAGKEKMERLFAK
jgi:sugar phosphate isomerase/epimerase